MTYKKLRQYCERKQIKITTLSEEAGFAKTFLTEKTKNPRLNDKEINEEHMTLIATAIQFHQKQADERLKFIEEQRNRRYKQETKTKQSEDDWEDVMDVIQRYSLLNEDIC